MVKIYKKYVPSFIYLQLISSVFFFYVYFALAFLYKMYKSAEQEVEEMDKRDNLPKLDSVLKILMGKVCQKCNVPKVIVNSRLVQEFKI